MQWLKYKLLKWVGGEEMVTVYATLIVKGYKKFTEVPVKLQPAVEQELAALGLDRNGQPLPIEE